MKSAGVLVYNDTTYIVMINYGKNINYYYLLSRYHKEDIPTVVFGGNDIKYPVYDLLDYTARDVDMNYIVGCVKHSVIGGSMSYYGNKDILLDVLDNMRLAITYSFKQSDIISDMQTQVSEDGILRKTFSGRDSKYSISYTRVFGNFESLSFSSSSLSLTLSPSINHRFPSSQKINPLLSELQVSKLSRVYGSKAKIVDYESIINKMDHSWYFTVEENGNITYHKDYRDITNVADFERYVIDELVEEIKTCRRNNTLPVVIGVDTETNGLDNFDIPPEHQSTVVAIPFSCKDDSGRLIYTDMECFSNVPMDYVKTRLEPFLKKDILNVDADISITTSTGEFTFKRSEVFIVGQNFMFDVRAFLVHDMQVWFDADCLQLSFNLDPFRTKGRNGLKEVTHFLFGHETLDLVDVLGKGNEDKFRNITDRRVAVLYGCPDGDYTRKVHLALKDIYAKCIKFHRKDLYKAHLKQDVLLMNVCAKMDFTGILINVEEFVKQGKAALADMDIIINFARSFVGRMLEINNYIYTKNVFSRTEYNRLLTAGHDHETALAEAELLSSKKIKPPNLEETQPYNFDFAGNSLRQTLYSDLNYPVLVRTKPPKDSDKPSSSGIPAINKKAMTKLMQQVSDTPQNFLASDILGADEDPDNPLIKASEFNRLKYPVAYLVSLIGPRKKEYDSYFKPFVEDSYGNKLCKSTSFSRIDTRRLSNPIQTIKGSLKKYILPYSEEYAFCDVDMSQVELRIMASLAQDAYTIDRMKDPEIDSHTETASQMFFKAAHLISKFERAYAKQVSFGYPYGLLEWSMCEKLFSQVNEENLIKTRKIIIAFKSAKKVIVDFLETVRDTALKPAGTCAEEPVPVPAELRRYLRFDENVPIGVVRNLMGFYKLFELNDLDKFKTARIRRQVGNFPIQSFAAELFRIILMRFYIACEVKGWNQKGLIHWHALIHDEILFSFKKGDIHPIELYDTLVSNCVVTFPGHTNYYIGINIGNTWYECKDDASEAPVMMVSRLLQRWKNGEFRDEYIEDPKTYIADKRTEYIIERIGEVVSECYPEVSSLSIDGRILSEKFENYVVKKYVMDTFKPLWKPRNQFDGKKASDAFISADIFDSCFCHWLLLYYADTSIEYICNSGERIQINPQYLSSIGSQFQEIFGISEVVYTTSSAVPVSQEITLEDGYYKEIDWDLDSSYSSYFIDYDQTYDDSTWDFDTYFDETVGGTFASMAKVKGPGYKHISIVGNRAFVDLDRKRNISSLEKYLHENSLITQEGVQLFYKVNVTTSKGPFISKGDIPLLDNFLIKLRG